MAALSVQVPFPVFYDRDGLPLDNGDIYIGTANTDALTNQIQVYYDEALTITASQPLKTSGGYIYRNGTPAQVYVNAADFSISVRESNGVLVYNFPEATGIGVGAASLEYDPPFTGAVTSGYTVADKLSQTISAKDFGAVGDGVTDDTVALQAAINAAVYFEKAALYIPAGIYLISDTLQLGYGVSSLAAAQIYGDGPAYRAEAGFAGTGIKMTRADRPAINCQGLRLSRIENLSIMGPQFTYYNTTGLGGFTPTVDDLNPANWIDPALLAANPNMDSRYAPSAGISIDAYSGPQPTPSYPAVTYPAFLGASIPQYNKITSSRIMLRNLNIEGFVVGVVNRPGDSDGNGDFINIEDCAIGSCKYGVSIGQTQARSNSITNTSFFQHYICLTNNTHGIRLGAYGGTISNCDFSWAIKMFTFNTFVKPLTFVNCYSELLFQLGDVVTGGSNEPPLVFQTCQFQFDHTDTKGVPAYVYGRVNQNEIGLGTAQAVRFENCDLRYKGVAVFGTSGPVLFVDTKVRSEERENGPKDAGGTDRQYVAYANNATQDGVIVMNDSQSSLHRIQSLAWNVDTLGGVGAQVLGTPSSASRTTLLPVLAKQATPQDLTAPPLPLPSRYTEFGKSTLASCTLVNKTLTFTFASWSDQLFAYAGPDIGDVIVDKNTGSTFFVRNRSSLTVTAELQNNYKSNGSGGFVTLQAFQPSVGNFLFLNSRFYILPNYLQGDSTSGSAVLTNCQRDNGSTIGYDSLIAVNDWVYINGNTNQWVSTANSKVAARNQGALTITLSGNAARTETREPLQLYIRQAATAVP